MEAFEYSLAGVVLLITFWLLIARRIRGAINGYGFQSIVLAAIAAATFVQSSRLHLLLLAISKDLLGQPVSGVAISVILIGFFIAVARSDAVMQLTGLLVAENGLLLLGLVMSAGLGLLVDFALLLDVLVGAVVMGFLIARMNTTIMSTDTGELTRLRG